MPSISSSDARRSDASMYQVQTAFVSKRDAVTEVGAIRSDFSARPFEQTVGTMLALAAGIAPKDPKSSRNASAPPDFDSYLPVRESEHGRARTIQEVIDELWASPSESDRPPAHRLTQEQVARALHALTVDRKAESDPVPRPAMWPCRITSTGRRLMLIKKG